MQEYWNGNFLFKGNNCQQANMTILKGSDSCINYIIQKHQKNVTFNLNGIEKHTLPIHCMHRKFDCATNPGNSYAVCNGNARNLWKVE
jgi:hypothetical protein